MSVKFSYKKQASSKYANSLFEIAYKNQNLELVQKKFENIYKLLQDKDLTNQLEKLLMFSNKSNDYKNHISQLLLSIQDNEQLFANFINLIISEKKISLLKEIYEQFYSLYLDNINTLQVLIVSITQLSSEECKFFTEFLEKKYGKQIIILNKISEKILGGYIIKVNSQVIDLSLRMKLKLFNQEIKENIIDSF